MKNLCRNYGVRRRVAALDGQGCETRFVSRANGRPARNIQSGDTSPHSIILACGVALLITAFACHAQDAVGVKPGPDVGGRLPESVRNEVEVAIDRGVKWIAAQQTEDGSFGKTNSLYFSMAANILFERPGFEKAAEHGKKWINKIGESDPQQKHIENIMIFFVGINLLANPDPGVEKTVWNNQLKQRLLSKQKKLGDIGFWKAEDVGLRIENGKWAMGKNDVRLSNYLMRAVSRQEQIDAGESFFQAITMGGENDEPVQAGADKIHQPTDFETTVCVLLMLKQL